MTTEKEYYDSLKFITGRFQEIVKDFDSFKVFKESVPKELLSFEEKLKSLSLLMGTHEKNLENSNSVITQQSNSQSSKHDILKHEVKGINDKIDKHVDLISALQDGRDTQFNQLRILEKAQDGYASKLSEAVIMNDLNKSKQKFDEDLTQVKSEFKNSLDIINGAHKRTFDFATQSRDEVLKKIESFSSSYDLLKKELLAHNQTIAHQFLTFANSVNDKIEQAIASIPKPIIPSLEDAKTAMRKELEPVSLDAKNANMRSSNTDNEIIVLKKKLESLALMIKKLEIEEAQ